MPNAECRLRKKVSEGPLLRSPNSVISLAPDPSDPRAVTMTSAAIPSNPVKLLAWESAYYLNWSDTGWRQVKGSSEPWKALDNGGLRRFLRSHDGVAVTLELRPTQDWVDLHLEARNITAEVKDSFWDIFALRHFWLDLCTHYRNARDFFDPDFARTRIAVEGAMTPLRQTDLSASCKQCLPGYLVEGNASPCSPLPEFVRTYGAAMSATKASAPWIGVESKDGSASLLTGFPRVHYLWANRRPPVHGCIHSQPLLGDIPPAATRHARGRIYFCRRPLAEVVKDFERTFVRPGRAGE